MTTYAVTRYHQEVQDWIAAHGVEPGDVPILSDITVDDGKVTLTRLQRDENGNVVFADGAGQLETVTVDQVAPWPLPEGTDL
ncbi:hypothetical protein GCM10027258_62730 [Amycolatopsis stemonae]